MNYCWLSLKGVQLLLCVLIAILFIVPQTLVVNDEALLQPGKTNLTSVDTQVVAKHLLCSAIEYDFYDAETDWLGVKPKVKFPDDIERPKKDSLEHVRRTLGCLQFYTQGSKSDCLCWDSYLVISVVVVAIATAATTICDMVTIYAAEGQDEHTSFVQGMGSCICSVLTGVIWVITGGIVVHYVFIKWPYQYYDADDGEDKIFFNIPNTWKAGLFFCFSFAVVLLMEGMIYLGESGRKPLQIIHLPGSDSDCVSSASESKSRKEVRVSLKPDTGQE